MGLRTSLVLFALTLPAAPVLAVGLPARAATSPAAQSLPDVWLAVLIAVAVAGILVVALGRRLRRAIADLGSAAASLIGTTRLPAQASASTRELAELRGALEEAHATLSQERQARASAEAETNAALNAERSAREAAERETRAKDEFIAMLGHELRNPLSAMSAALAVLRHLPPAPGSEGEAREVIARQTRHLSAIADDLLDLGRLMHARVGLALEPRDLGATCRAAVSALEEHDVITKGSAAIHCPAPVWVRADPARLEQALGILLTSVARTGHGAGERLEVRIERSGAEAHLGLRMSGAQPLPEYLRAASPERPSRPGTPPDQLPCPPSVAMTIAERLVQMHAGTIASRPARRGCEYIVRLPLAEPADPADASRAVAAQSALRVLVVDDHDDSRTMLRILLQQGGHAVIEAVDGVDGVQLALCSHPALAIVDIGLPGIDGYEVARRLRKLPRGHEMALIALTGYGQAEDKERALRAGFDLHLVKPVDEAKLAEALERAARRASGGL